MVSHEQAYKNRRRAKAGLLIGVALLGGLKTGVLDKTVDIVAQRVGRDKVFNPPHPDPRTRAQLAAAEERERIQAADANTICIPEGVQRFDFKPAQGKDNAIFVVKGIENRNDPCWDETEALVLEALKGQLPQAGKHIYIPAEMVKQPKQPGK